MSDLPMLTVNILTYYISPMRSGILRILSAGEGSVPQPSPAAGRFVLHMQANRVNEAALGCFPTAGFVSPSINSLVGARKWRVGPIFPFSLEHTTLVTPSEQKGAYLAEIQHGKGTQKWGISTGKRKIVKETTNLCFVMYAGQVQWIGIVLVTWSTQPHLKSIVSSHHTHRNRLIQVGVNVCGSLLKHGTWSCTCLRLQCMHLQ